GQADAAPALVARTLDLRCWLSGDLYAQRLRQIKLVEIVHKCRWFYSEILVCQPRHRDVRRMFKRILNGYRTQTALFMVAHFFVIKKIFTVAGVDAVCKLY